MSWYFLGGFSAYGIEPSARPGEPVFVFLQPRMVRRALNRKIQRHLQSLRACCLDQTTETFQPTEFGMDFGMTAIGCANRVWAARLALHRRDRIIAALAVVQTDRVDRWHVQHVEVHRADMRQPFDHIVKGAMPVDITALRARKQLVPTGEVRRAAFRFDPEGDRIFRAGTACRRPAPLPARCPAPARWPAAARVHSAHRCV